jgi:hypothetical protein
MRRLLARLLVLLLATGWTGAAEAQQGKRFTLDQLRRALQNLRADQPKGGPPPIDLAGYSFHWELRLGDTGTLVVISRNLGGYVLTFAPQGALKGLQATDEIVSMQLCELDDDGVPELITDEIVGRGTGILSREFRVYRVSATPIRRLWNAPSFEYLEQSRPGEKAYFSTVRAFLRCDPSGGGDRPQLDYRREENDGRGKVRRFQTLLELRGSRLVEGKSAFR